MTEFLVGAAIGAIAAAVAFDWYWFDWTLKRGRCLHCGTDLSGTQGHFCAGWPPSPKETGNE